MNATFNILGSSLLVLRLAATDSAFHSGARRTGVPVPHVAGRGGAGGTSGAGGRVDASESGPAGAANELTASAPDAGFKLDPACSQPAAEASCHDGLCLIPPGCFAMGTPRDALTAARFDNAQVQVTLTHAFLLGRTEVTRAEWFAMGLPEPTQDWRTLGSSAAETPPPGYAPCTEPDCPVLWVSFEDAVAYTNLRSEAEGLKPCYLLDGCMRRPGDNMRCASVVVDAASPYACEGYRLPTEAEWEYGARAGTQTDLYAGDLDSALDPSAFECELDTALDRIGWYCGNSGAPPHRAGTGRAHPVAQKLANAFGLHDMAGNAFEWTNDRYQPAGYGAGPLVDPVHGVEMPWNLTPNTPIFMGMPDGNFVDGFPGFRIRRSGAFDLFSQLTGSGRRDHGYVAGQHTGLRIARTLPRKPGVVD